MRSAILTVILLLAAVTVGVLYYFLDYSLAPWLIPGILGLIAFIQAISLMVAYDKAKKKRGSTVFGMVVWFLLFIFFVFATVYLTQNEFSVDDLFAIDPTLSPADPTNPDTAKLLDFVEDKDALVFDYALNNDAQGVKIEVYILLDGAWETMTGDNFSDLAFDKGRIALSYDHLMDGMGVALQGKQTDWLGRFTAPSQMDITGRALYNKEFETQQPIEYGVEIPLAIQAVSSQSGRYTQSVEECFQNPEVLAPYAYDFVYAVTVEFSQAPQPQSEQE